MITAVIGRQFLAAYNEKHGLALSVDDYFSEHFVPLFFDHPKYLMDGGNAPLSNPKFKKGTYPDAPDRAVRKERWFKLLAENPGGSSPLGFPTLDPQATTSGQVSTTAGLAVSTEEAMFSWLGGALGIGMQGAVSLLVPVPAVLLAVEEGWHEYRRLLTERPELRPNQINTWNGQWLRHRSKSGGVVEVYDSDTFSVSDGVMSVETTPWLDVLLALARLLPAEARLLTVYAYSLGQMNTTIGFVPVDLSGVRSPILLYKKLFGDEEYARNTAFILSAYGTEFGFRKACAAGAIGTYALLPKGLRGLMPSANGKDKLPSFQKATDQQVVTYHVYITWLLAMLNDDSLWSRAQEAADLLYLHASGGKKIGKSGDTAVKAVLEAASRKQFIAALTVVVAAANAQQLDELRSLAQRVDTMPPDNYGYFLTLVRFCYALAERQPAVQQQLSL